MGKRANGEGSIYKRKSDGRWVGSITLSVDMNGKARRRVVYGDTQTEVKEKLTALKGDAQKGVLIEPHRITVDAHFEAWLQERELSTRPGTWQRDRSHFRTHISPQLGHIRLRDLSHKHVTEFYLYLTKESGLSPRTAYDVGAILRSGLRDAVAKGLLARSPGEISKKLPKPDDEEARFLDHNELAAFIRAAHGSRLEHLFTLMIHTGLRPGEALGLTWQNIDFGKGTLTVKHTLVENDDGGPLRLGPCKTKGSRRTISLSVAALTALQKQRVLQQQQRQKVKHWVNDLNLVFTARWGEPLRQGTVIKHDLAAILSKAGLKDVTLHTFRHTHASMLLYAGIDPKTISERLGHADVSTTLRIYSHLMVGQDERAAAAMDQLIESLPTGTESGKVIPLKPKENVATV